ncbi:MAG: sulfotransferase [Chloroflexi bacterium]|nr:sulfotransferase [Chloroflexota bacterium]
MRILRTHDTAAYFAVFLALLGVLCTPLDILLKRFEEKRYQAAGPPKMPLIVVVGAPRSGTTLAEQILINNLPVTYFNNLTSLFPRSPITANRIWGRFFRRPKQVEYQSYYGRSTGFAGPNDALYLWDRWLGDDRRQIPTELDKEAAAAMVRFFGAYEVAFGQSIVAKNNNLNVCASIVGEHLENAHFICLTRDPLYLAQSLLLARMDIHGDMQIPYGVSEAEDQDAISYVENVCRQVLFHEQKIREQQALIGPDRFWIVSYEELCADPQLLAQRVAAEVLDLAVDAADIERNVRPFQVHNRVRVAPALFADLEATLAELRESGE